MTLSVDRSVEAISAHSRALAEAARDNLDARVEHCPEWSVADLVRHVTEVHWFWATVARTLPTGPPDESQCPARAPDDQLVDTFLAGADDLVETLRAADQSADCWTWFPLQQDVAFITRHQVQEAAVHHWDAANAAGQGLSFDTDVAVDSVEEFLTTSLADADDIARSGRSLDGELVLRATDTGQVWTVRQVTPDAAVTWVAGGGSPTVAGTSSELLLWIYDRVQLDQADPALVARFRSLSSTD